MRHLLTTMLGLALLLALVGTATAQEASPESTLSPPPVPLDEPMPQEMEAVDEPLPVADYWVEWINHKQDSYARVSAAIRNAKTTSSDPAPWYRRLVGVHKDELRWLVNHQPQACYEDEYEQWRRAVEDLHAIHAKALRFVRAGKAAGVRRTDKQRREAMDRLDSALTNLALCGPSVPDTTAATASGNPLVGRWLGVRPFVSEDGVNVTHRIDTKITRDGRFLVRVKRDDFCRRSGLGFVPLTAEGRGDFITDGALEFRWSGAKAHCYPRRGGRKLVGQGLSNEAEPWRYHEAYDVMTILDAGDCWWRKGGGPTDCKAFWRGTPPESDDVAAPPDGETLPEEEATAASEESEG